MEGAVSATGLQSNKQQQPQGRQFDEAQYQCGLNYARSLNFTDEQYEEALKRIERPDNANQLLVALIDVSSQQEVPLTRRETEPDDLSLMGQFDVGDKSTDTFCTPANAAGQHRSTSSSSCSSLTSSSGISSLALHPGAYECGAAGPRATSFVSPASSAPSTANQSLESLSQQLGQHTGRLSLTRTSSSSSNGAGAGGGGGELRRIYVDGANVAKTHGRDSTFSWAGIAICVEWFRARQHHVRVLVPENKFLHKHGPPHPAAPTANTCESQFGADQQSALDHLTKLEVLVRTPSGCNDDLMIIEAARQNDGIIVSNDQYRDERRRHWAPGDSGGESLDQFVASHRLPYVFVDDLFIPAADPQGRNGPSLEEFLRVGGTTTSEIARGNAMRSHARLGKTRSHQMPRQHNGRGSYNARGYSAIFRSQPAAPLHQQPQHSFYQASNPVQPDYTSSRQIHSWQGPARPSMFESTELQFSRPAKATFAYPSQPSTWFGQREPRRQNK